MAKTTVYIRDENTYMLASLSNGEGRSSYRFVAAAGSSCIGEGRDPTTKTKTNSTGSCPPSNNRMVGGVWIGGGGAKRLNKWAAGVTPAGEGRERCILE